MLPELCSWPHRARLLAPNFRYRLVQLYVSVSARRLHYRRCCMCCGCGGGGAMGRPLPLPSHFHFHFRSRLVLTLLLATPTLPAALASIPR